MRKIFKISLATLSLTMVILLSGCSNVEVVRDGEIEKSSMFVQVESTVSWRVVYHKETKVMYVVSYGSYNSGNFTLLVNPDGTPMIYDGGR